jgi:uncharacterized protein (TIGR02266 family)
LTFRDRQSFINAYSTDISPGGLFIKTEKPFPKGERFLINLQLPELPAPLKINCEVVWVKEQGDDERKPLGMGIKFCEMSKQDGQTLQRYLKDILPA